jgi:integrase
MGLYRRTWRNRDGKLITSPPWWMDAVVDGHQVCKPTGVTNKKAAQKIYDAWKAEIAQGRFDLLKKAPKLMEWAEKYLNTVDHPNTRTRYESSKENLVSFFGEGAQLDHLSTARIERFKQQRREGGVKGSTINRDLRFLAQILKQAERERCLARSPFDRTKFFLNESRDRRKPYILSWEEQEKLLAVASPRLRVFVVLGVETGMRTGEMLKLQWKDIDFLNDVLQVGRSKTSAGIRAVPISAQCKAELLRWRNLIGPEFSEWVFPNFTNRRHPLQRGGRKAWANALKKAGLPFFPIYYLRHTFASRLTSAGVSPLTIAQMLGHSSTQIVPRYAQVLDQNRLDAMKKLEVLKQSTVGGREAVESPADETVQGIRQ